MPANASRPPYGIALILLLLLTNARAQPPQPLEALERMPVREVTIFKDGHALMMHRGTMPVNEHGVVAMDYLPAPVLGTFWPFSADENATLHSVTAGQHKMLVDRTATNLRDLIEANAGARILATEARDPESTYEATILDIPSQSGEEKEALDTPYSGPQLSQKGGIVLLQTSSGVKVVNLDAIRNISFLEEYNKTLPREEMRSLLSLQLESESDMPSQADVGIMYLQRGIRWIPSYRVTIDGEGEAHIQLQATLVNEMLDLEDVTANLVVGVPAFSFEETVDPISLQQTVARLSSHFQPDSQYYLSNAIMSQTAAFPQHQPQREAPATMDLGPDVANTAKNEELYVFTIDHITLRKGQRMVLPITEFTVPYEDIYVLDIPYAPPLEMLRNINDSQQRELARQMTSPKVMHKIRLRNTSRHPLTTAPALILRGERILAQGLMTYAAPGASTDLPITASVDIVVNKTDNETSRTPNAVEWQGYDYGRVDLAGTIALTSFREDPVTVEVVRHVLGNVDSASREGDIAMTNVFESLSYAGEYPSWWGWFNWPWWWYHFNSAGRIAWTVELQPQEPAELNYTWHYFWR